MKMASTMVPCTPNSFSEFHISGKALTKYETLSEHCKMRARLQGSYPSSNNSPAHFLAIFCFVTVLATRNDTLRVELFTQLVSQAVRYCRGISVKEKQMMQPTK